jgi:hypothetical protein
MVPNQLNVYLDDNSDDLGSTQLTKVISVEFAMDSVYGPAWFLNRSDASYSAHVDIEPGVTFKLMVEADANGMAMLDYVRSGATYYLRVDALGSQIASDGGSGSDPIYNSFQHDMAVKFGKPQKWQDSDGIFAIEWDAQIVEDLTWGMAHQFTLVNLLTAL